MKLWGTKIIYFVRHGESAHNASHIRQGASGGLSEKGKAQSRFLGERFLSIKPEVMIVSTYERAKETAAIINEAIHCPVEYSELLKERRNPSEIIGKDAESDEVRKIMDTIDRSYHDEQFRYSDEENFVDLKKRALEVLDMLTKRKETRIVCVSHRIFIKMLIACIEKGETLDSHTFVKLDFFNKVSNTAIALCSYNPWLRFFRKNPWEILAFNEYGNKLD